MISLCEKCLNNNWRYMQEIIEGYKSAGLPLPHHIWCAYTDRPEDLQFDHCQGFQGYKKSNRVNTYRANRSGHRRIKKVRQ